MCFSSIRAAVALEFSTGMDKSELALPLWHCHYIPITNLVKVCPSMAGLDRKRRGGKKARVSSTQLSAGALVNRVLPVAKCELQCTVHCTVFVWPAHVSSCMMAATGNFNHSSSPIGSLL
jgi:hypothetical protein